MAKKFSEHNGLNLVATNNNVLAEWMKNDIFHKSIEEREGQPQFIFLKDHLRQTDTPVFTMYWHVPSRILSTATRLCRAFKFTERLGGTHMDYP